MARRRVVTEETGTVRTLIQWRAVFGGAVVGLAAFALLAALWAGFAFGSGIDWIADNLDWFLGGSAIFAMFLAGMLAGWEAGLLRGFTAGMLHGVTVWAVFVLAAIVFGAPAVASLFNVTGTQDLQNVTQTVPMGAAWPTFYALAIGFGAAMLGGILGGGMRRPAGLYLTERETERERVAS